MQVRIEDRNVDGRGRARAGRRVVLVSQAHPGEELSVRTDVVTRGTVQGRVARLVERDPSRLAHECRHEFHCTGCPLLAAALDDESAFKTARLASALEELRGFSLPAPEAVLRPGPVFGYRHLAKQVFGRRAGHVVLGSFVAGTHRVTDNDDCPVLAPPLRELTHAIAGIADECRLPLDERGVRAGLRHVVARLSRSSGEMILLLATSEDPPERALDLCRRLLDERRELAGAHVLVQLGSGNALLAGEVRWSAGRAFVEDEILGFSHRIGPRSFFQINPEAAETMFRLAAEAAGTGGRCLEVFAGVGALTLPLAARFGEVVAIEASAEAAASLREAAARSASGTNGTSGTRAATEASGTKAATEANGASGPSLAPAPGRIELLEGRAERRVPEVLRTFAPEVVVLDPPRAGASPAVMEPIAASGARRCVLIGCEPGALARDLAPLLRAGWAVERIVPIDQFPRTAHLETIAVAVRP